MRSLEKKHQQLGMRINILRMQPDIVIPTSTGLDRYVSLLEVECRRLAADQEVRDARAAQSSEVVVAAEVAEKSKGQGRLFFPLEAWRLLERRQLSLCASRCSERGQRRR